MLIISIIIMFYIGIKYINSNDIISSSYAMYSLVLAFLGMIGMFFIDFFDNQKINIIPKTFNDFNINLYLTATLIMWIFSIIIDFLLQITLNYALSDTDLILYYVFAAICEEAFFRGFLINLFIFILSRKEQKPKIIVILFSIIISSFLFMIAHLSVYGNNLSMLLSTFIGGIMLGFGYIIFRDMSANMSAHFLKNIVGAINLVKF